MTQQELDAIKKKCENAQEIGLTGVHMGAAVFDAYLKDIPALLAEVERLNIIGSQRYKLYDSALTTIEKLKAEQPVRCKDCKHHTTYWWCGYHSSNVGDNDFCSYGERKEN